MKDKFVAAILAFFFGIFGVHRFYLGQHGLGVLYMFFFWTGIPALIGVIDAILFLSMDRDDFDFKYNRRIVYPDHRRFDTDFSRNERTSSRREEKALREQRRAERRQQVKQQSPTQRHHASNPTSVRKDNPFKLSGIQKYKDFDYDAAIEDFKKALAIHPTDVAVHFNLACTYSLSEEKESAFFHLSKAVEFGFVDFKKLQEHDALAYLRIQDEFEIFKRNGYRLNVPPPPEMPLPEIQTNLDLPSAPDSKEDLINKSSLLLDQIKRLGELREEGLLSNDEFEAQKRRLLD